MQTVAGDCCLQPVRSLGKMFPTFRGREGAHIVPASSFVKDKETNLAHDLKVWAQMEDLAEEIGALWPEGVSAEEAIREQRREL